MSALELGLTLDGTESAFTVPELHCPSQIVAVTVSLRQPEAFSIARTSVVFADFGAGAALDRETPAGVFLAKVTDQLRSSAAAAHADA